MLHILLRSDELDLYATRRRNCRGVIRTGGRAFNSSFAFAIDFSRLMIDFGGGSADAPPLSISDSTSDVRVLPELFFDNDLTKLVEITFRPNYCIEVAIICFDR